MGNEIAQPNHENQTHVHSETCGHTKINHNGHMDYLQDGHLHRLHDGHIDEHRIEVSEANPDKCTSARAAFGHDRSHVHGPGCGHEAIPHGNHIDYLVDGHLHHVHDSHCDDHGAVETVK